MGFFRREKRDNGENRITPETSAELLRAIIGNDEMTAEKALEIPAFSASVDFISDTVSMLPVKLYREDKTAHTTVEITDDKRLFLLNDEADSFMGAAACRRAQIRDMLIYGSGFVFIEQRYNGDVTALRYVEKRNISVVSNGQPIFRDFNINVGGRTYLPFNFVILARNSPDGVTGKGAVEEHKTLLSSMYSLMIYEKVLTKTGGNKKGFLQSERVLSDDAIAKLKQEWKDLYANNECNMIVLNSGIKYQPSASTSVEMQLNENKRTNSEQIAQIFGLSPDLTAGKSTTEGYMAAVRTAVLPVVEKVQEALNRALLTEAEKGEYYFVLDTAELLKGDTLARYQAYEIALRNNFLQLDEVRYLEDKSPLGFDFMRLGLNDVLYDVRTKTVYTPNMNAFQRLNGNSPLTTEEERAIMELRRKTNWVKGKGGKFAGSVSNGLGGYTKMSKSEQKRVSGEIMTWHPNYKSGSSHCGSYGDYFYGFKVLMPGSYNFTLKMKIAGNEDFIKRYRRRNNGSDEK